MAAGPKVNDSALETAMDWFLRLQEAPGDSDLLAEKDRWVAADAEHGRAWRQASKAMDYVTRIPPRHAAAWEPKRVAVPSAAGTRRGWKFVAGLAIAASLAVAALPQLLLAWQADYATGRNERQDVALADGSRMILGPESAAAIEIDESTRNVTLISGEIFLEVAKGQSVPFRVAADAVEITVTGTAFDVQRSATRIAVGVVEGSVEVQVAGREAIALTPGQQFSFDQANGVGRVDAKAVADLAAWREGLLYVDNASVAAVAADMQRYQAGWVFVPDSVLGEKRVTGLYDLADPDRAMLALVQPYGGRVLEITPWIHILTAE